jgi:hypothetical protein
MAKYRLFLPRGRKKRQFTSCGKKNSCTFANLSSPGKKMAPERGVNGCGKKY